MFISESDDEKQPLLEFLEKVFDNTSTAVKKETEDLIKGCKSTKEEIMRWEATVMKYMHQITYYLLSIDKNQKGKFHLYGGKEMKLGILRWQRSTYLAVPATSTPSERAFSVAGCVVNKKHARILPENVNILILIISTGIATIIILL